MSPEDSIFDFSKDEYDDDLFSSKEALDFLKKLYARPASEIAERKQYRLGMLEHFLGKELPIFMGMTPMNKEMLSHFRQIPAIEAAVLEQVRLPILCGKTVIGVGGAFSAGKSSFLNVHTGLDALPTNQEPTTAVGTYILHGEKFSIQAFTRYGRMVELDKRALQNISHSFYDKYHIGFADILHKIIITSDVASIPEGIVLLDTPGYNKPDQGQQECEVTKDNRIAHQHLLGCDYLIWLVSVDSGTLTSSDIDFIKNLELREKCLFIVNKADLKPEEQVLEVVTEIEKDVRQAGIPCFGVTAYSAFQQKECLNRNLIVNFMETAAKNKPHQDCINELETIRELWLKNFKEQEKKLKSSLDRLEEVIARSYGAMNIIGMITLYRSMMTQSNINYHNCEDFTDNIDFYLKELQHLLS